MISIQHFSKKYKKEPVIEQSDFKILNKKITFLMGQNGSGKTTFIKCLTGLTTFDGRISFSDNKDCLVIWDDTPFYTNLSGIANLKIFCESNIRKNELIDISKKYLDHELLTRKVKTYSYGQKKKLALALAEIIKPNYLIMDEISNGLDFQFGKQLKTSLVELSETTTILLTGHQFDFYNGILDDLLAFENKKIISLEKNFKKDNNRLEDIYESMY